MATNNLNICLFPMELVWNDVSENLKKLEKTLDEIHPDTDIVVLPETFTTGFPSNYDKEDIQNLIKGKCNDVCDKIKELAKKHNLAIAGSMVFETDDKIFNRGFFIEPNGEFYYGDKRHLFSMVGEDKLFVSGEKRLIVRFRGWNISLIICYDLRFPVWCRNKNNEYDLLIVVANWPKTRIEAWDKLLPARAIENEAYVAGVNCLGYDKLGYEYNGSSHIYNYKGKEIGNRISPFIYASLSHEKLNSFRSKFPAWKDADTFNIDL